MVLAETAAAFYGRNLFLVPDGQVRIDELKEGSEVISFDDKGNTTSHKHSVGSSIHEKMTTRFIAMAIWGDETCRCNSQTTGLNQYNAFVAIAEALVSMTACIDVMGHLTANDKPRKAWNGHYVYNFTVERQHTFIANNIRVHNAGLGTQLPVLVVVASQQKWWFA